MQEVPLPDSVRKIDRLGRRRVRTTSERLERAHWLTFEVAKRINDHIVNVDTDEFGHEIEIPLDHLIARRRSFRRRSGFVVEHEGEAPPEWTAAMNELTDKQRQGVENLLSRITRNWKKTEIRTLAQLRDFVYDERPEVMSRVGSIVGRSFAQVAFWKPGYPKDW